MKNYILLCTILLILGCNEESIYEIPLDENGNVFFYEQPTSTTDGITTLDDEFSVTGIFATANSGDVMNVQLLQIQEPPSGGAPQLLPLGGTQKQITLGDDLKETVSYSRSDAKLDTNGDAVTVVFEGESDYIIKKVTMNSATSVSGPQIESEQVEVVRTSEPAYFNVTVSPKSTAYTNDLIVKRKNGLNEDWEDLPESPFNGNQPFLVPVKGADFDAKKDTMFYLFTSSLGQHIDEIMKTVIVREPYFLFLKSTSLVLDNNTSAGIDLFNSENVGKNSLNANIVVSDSLIFRGGPTWIEAGNSIQFVPSEIATYEANNLDVAIAEFNQGVQSKSANPTKGEGVYIFKVLEGTSNGEEVYYGMIKVNSINPNESLSFEYRIGDKYSHLLSIK